MGDAIKYAWICHASPVQVLYKESCLGTESSRCRAQLDCLPSGRMGTSSEHGPALVHEGNQVIPSFPYPSYGNWQLLIGP